ncbi:hypothetical protein [Sphingomonas sp. Root241]|uniref:hypothetical protein n=1 Tax=Sphingomonas sp. Root241 TaxID=1736501 RepID=UPI0012E3F5BC|nr:hypothetical protein [Sphingomonas sp. Root241]
MVAKKRSGSTQEVQTEIYLFRIEEVVPNYSFGISLGQLQVGPYAEYHHTEVETVCVSPKRFANRSTNFTLMGDRSHTADLTHPNQDSRARIGVGTLTMRGDQSSYLGSLPLDAALPIPALIQSGGYKFIYLAGEPVRYGSASIRYISFYHDYDVNEL